MATSNSIQFNDNNGLHNILRPYYVNNSTVYPITSIWKAETGQEPVLIWPREYDSILTVVPSRDINNPVPASGGTVNLSWYLTVYYPNTLDVVPGFNNKQIQASQLNSYTNWVGYTNYYTDSYSVDTSQTNKSKIVLPNRDINALPSTTTGDNQLIPYIDPNQHPYWTDGGWSYNVRASVNFTINNRTYTAYTNNYLSDGVEVCRQEANDLLNWDGTVPSTLGDAYSNWKSVEIGGGSWWTYWTSTDQQVTSDNPAPYTAGTLNPSITAYKHEQWKFTSGSIYNTYRYFTDWNNSTYSLPGPFTFSITNKSVSGDWINVNDMGYVTLTENTSTNSRNARVYLSRPSGLSSSFWTNRYVTVYQAGKPSS